MMRAVALAFFLILSVAGISTAGQPLDPREQRSLPQTQVIIQDNRSGLSWTEIIVGLIGTGGALGAAYIGVRYKRKD
jgi:hypothetical protein